jgi:hypothetical protein
MDLFTADELLALVHDSGFQATLNVDEDQYSTIDVEIEDLAWRIVLGVSSPFYGHMTFSAFKLIDLDPLLVANRWNGTHAGTVQVVEDDDGETLYVGEDNNFILLLTWFIPFFGSVTSDYLKYVINHWNDEVCEFLEIEEDINDFSASETTSNEHPLSVPVEPINRLEQIKLELGIRSPQSSRELARSLKTTKYEINNVLYHNDRVFLKHGNTPPMWSLR